MQRGKDSAADNKAGKYGQGKLMKGFVCKFPIAKTMAKTGWKCFRGRTARMRGQPGDQGQQSQIITGVLKVEDDHVNQATVEMVKKKNRYVSY